MLQKSPPREALGRGLGSFFPMTTLSGDQSPSVFFCGLEKIVPNENQPRKAFDDAALEELAQSIHEKGLLQPIIVRKHPRVEGKYEIIAGERRFRASQKAGLDEIPVLLKNTDDQETLELALIENIQREALNPLEEARAFEELVAKYAYTHDELAQKLGKSRSVIANALRLLKLPEPVAELLEDGSLSNGHARALLALDDTDQQITLAIRILDESLSVRETEALIQQLKAGTTAGEVDSPAPKTAKPDEASTHQRWLEDQFRQALGTKVQLRQKGDKGKLVIEFFSKVDLERIYAILVKTRATQNISEESLY